MVDFNNSPLLCMHQIIGKLWNNHFLSDIEFVFDNEKLHAHSILLMCRSIVFEKKFEKTQGTRQIIPMKGYLYNTFKQFLRFIYHDECDMTEDNTLELLELALVYKVPRLENLLISFIIMNYSGTSMENKMKLLEFCLTANYELLCDWMNDNVANDFNELINSEYFLKLQPATIEHILKFSFLTDSVTEYSICNAVLKWMNKYCAEHDIAPTERYAHFSEIIHLIRFPTMSVKEFSSVVKSNRDLFSNTEYGAFYEGGELDGWDSRPRTIMNPRSRIELTVNFPNGLVRYIKSKVDIIFIGLWLGSIYDVNFKSISMSMIISPYQSIFEFPMTFRLANHNKDYVISFGESFLLKGNHTYSIRIYFLDQYNHRTINVDSYPPLLKQKWGSNIANEIEVNDHGNLGNIFKLYFQLPKTAKPK